MVECWTGVWKVGGSSLWDDKSFSMELEDGDWDEDDEEDEEAFCLHPP